MKRLLFFICTCFACVLTAQAQDNRTFFLQLNDTVTIRYNDTYLLVDDNGTTIIAHGEPNDNALWKIVGCKYTGSGKNAKSQYQFQHVKTGDYLHVNEETSGSYWRPTVSLNLALAANPSLFYGSVPNNQNAPVGTAGQYEATRMYYNYESKGYYLTVASNAWKLQQSVNQTIYIEKWEKKRGNIGFGAYFSPEAYDFSLVKPTYRDANNIEQPVSNDSIVQTKKIRFVVDLRDSTYVACVRTDGSDKKLLLEVTEERDLSDLIETYHISPTFKWNSNSDNNTTSTLTLPTDGYTSTEETENRPMMSFEVGENISEDNLAWEITLNALGKSPMGLKRLHNGAVETWDNYVDYLEATWTYNNTPYKHQMRIIRKSYHTEELPEFEFTVSPSTYTFDGDGGERIIQIDGYHQHGLSYYDVDNQVIERVYTYPRTHIPLQDFDVDGDTRPDLTVNFTCTTLDDTTTPVNWLSVKQGSITNNSVTVVAQANNDVYRRARLYGTFTLTKGSDGKPHEHSGVIMPIINQRKQGVGSMKFKHYKGIAEDATLDPITHRQQVHTTERTIYYTPNQDIQLQLAEANFFGYMRWYDYDSATGDGGDPYWNSDQQKRTSWVTSPRGGNGTAFRAINTEYGQSRGLYGTNNKNGDNSGGDSKGGPLTRDSENTNAIPVLKGWNYTPTKKEGDIDPNAYHTIACDVSAYTDYQVWYTGDRRDSIQEPTLSYRQLFHMKPAEEMARELCKKSHMDPGQFLENYTYLAERGTDMHLATNYRYAKYSHESELCYFFFDKAQNLMRVGKDAQAQWYRTNLDANGNVVSTTTITNPNYTVKDFLRVDADYDGKVIYELRVPKDKTSKTGNPLDHDILIARFEITIVQDGACGPVGGNGLMSIQEMNEHYQLLEHIDFSFGAPAPGTTNLRQLNKHLPWEQSTYGYYYPKEGGNYADQTDVDYNILGQTSSNRADQHIPYYGEYFLINKIDKDWARAEQHGGAANGYALYVDGTTEPGRVISISTDAVICAGQTLYCSAWVCNPNPSTNDGRMAPIFRFNVEGREKKADNTWGEWEDVSVYFAGTLKANSGWQQIVFPVLSDKSYDETRVSLYNFATGGNGNDFMVDDISLFVSRLPLASYQAQTNCSSDANTESSTAVVLRIDYTDFQGERDEYMYYQIFKEKNAYDPDDTAHPIKLEYTNKDESAYFHDNQANSDAKEYGSVRIPTQDFDPVEYNKTANEENKDTILIFQTVQGFKDYLVDQVQNDPTGEKSTHAKAYIKTTDSRGQSKWLIYVMHIVPNAKERDENGNLILGESINENKYLRECYNYSLRMANVPEELAAPECNLQTPLHATQATHFDLYNGDKIKVKEGFIPVSLDNCANDYYTLTSVIENVMAITTGGELDKVRGAVLSDWLVGFEFDSVYANTKIHESKYQEAVRQAEVQFKNKYGYTRAQVKTAILYDLRRQDTLNTNLTVDKFEALDPHAFADPFNYTVIKHLHDNGWLQLRKSSTSFYLASEEAVRYWVYPIDGTASATYANQTVVLQDCTEPIWVTVTSEHSDHILNIAPVPNADKTDAQKRQLPTVRVLHSTLTDNTKTITIPITDINTATTASPVGDNTKIEFSLSNLNDNIHFVDSTTGQQMTAPTSFEIGKTYMMRMRFTDNGGKTHIGSNNTGCRVGTVYFRLLVLPNRVIWAPTIGIYDGWGLDGNWIGWNDSGNGTPEGTPDGKIQRNELTEGYVPMAGSEVIIGNVPRAEGVKLPTIDEYEHYPFVHDHNHYPMDVHASPFTCGKIYFAPGAHIHNQHLLQYEQAFVDMLIPSATWNTVSAPLQDMYSGDMFVPHSGWWNDGEKVEELNPFEVSNFQGKRHRDAAYAFSQAFYNQTVEKHYENKGGVNVSASAAFVTSNALSQKLEPAKGFSMRGYGPGNPQTETTLTIRLPKPDTEYAYFSPEGDETSQTTGQLSRANAGRLAFTPTGTGEDPAMAITLTNEVSGANQSFLFGNPTMALIDMQKLYEDNNNTSWTGTYSYITDNQWGASTQALDDNGRFLPPMTSVMLHTNSNSQSLTINLKPSHLTLSPRVVMSLEKGEPQPVAPRQSSVSDVPYSRPMTMSLYAYTDRASARAILAASPTASDRYQIGEDALFISSGVEMSNVVVTPLNMYTLSEQVPMMVDVRENIDSIPVALLAKDNYRSDSITFAFHLSANWDKECYFYDAVTGERVRIMDGTIIERPAPQNHENRYYIVGPDRTSNGENTETAIPIIQPDDIQVWAYSEQAGEMTVCSNDIIQSVTVYDMTGRLIAHKALDLLYNQVSLPVGQGVHIAEVTLRDNSKHYTRTIVK